MRILYITPYFSFRQGGVSEVVYQLATHLSKKGHYVTLLTSDYLTDKEIRADYAFEIVRLPSFSRWGFYVTPKMILWLKSNLENYDVVHLQEFRTFQNIIASSIARKASIPFVFTAHGTMPNIIEKRLIKALFDLFFKRMILKSINIFTAVSPKEVEHYRQTGIRPEQIALIYNGINVSSFTKTTEEEAENLDETLREGVKIIFLGRIHKLKRIDRLLDAFPEIISHHRDAQLIIAGPDNGEQTNLQNQARKLGLADQVSFPGPIYGEQKIAFLQSADVLAYPSAHEIFGLVPFEALLCGTPVVVTEGTGMGDLINQAGAGKTVPQDDPQAMAEALLWVLGRQTDIT
jgi:glycosyltransferase involved in cell wall biosynthesis